MEHLAVELPPLLLQDSAVGDFLHQRVRERQPVAVLHRVMEESSVAQHDGRAPEFLDTQAADPSQQRAWEGAADDCGHLEKPPLSLGESIDARPDHALNGLWKPQLAQRTLKSIAAGLAAQQAILGQRLDHLLEVHRRTFGVREQAPFELREARIFAEETIAALTGKVDMRFADTTLIDLAAGGTPVDLEFAYTLSAQAKLVLTAHEVYLPKPKLAVEGPGGVQASFDFRGAKNTTAGRMLTVTLTNDLDGTLYA
jgi:hypothetical protein